MKLKRLLIRIPGVKFLYNKFRPQISKAFVAISNIFRRNYIDFFYDDEYYRNNIEISSNVASVLVPLLIEKYKPKSVMDVGCGNGIYLKEFEKNKITVKGIDGSKSAIKNSLVDKKIIELHDLRNPYKARKKYDLAMCFEVAEHIETKASSTLVKTLTSLSDTIVLTAAPPGQGGTGHINEQPKKFWIKLFGNENFDYEKNDTSNIKKSLKKNKVKGFILNNIMVFKKKRR